MAQRGRASNVISHWHHPIANFQTSPLEFYAAVEQAIQPRQIPDLTTSRVDWKEGGLLSARREYLRVRRGKLAFDICAAPFGTGFFFSSWLAEVPPEHGLLYLLGIFIGSIIFFGISMSMFGFFGGFFFAVIAFPFLLGFLGYAIREGHLGSGAEDVLLAMLERRTERENAAYDEAAQAACQHFSYYVQSREQFNHGQPPEQQVPLPMFDAITIRTLNQAFGRPVIDTPTGTGAAADEFGGSPVAPPRHPTPSANGDLVNPPREVPVEPVTQSSGDPSGNAAAENDYLRTILAQRQQNEESEVKP